jgi:hypothetical protein
VRDGRVAVHACDGVVAHGVGRESPAREVLVVAVDAVAAAVRAGSPWHLVQAERLTWTEPPEASPPGITTVSPPPPVETGRDCWQAVAASAATATRRIRWRSMWHSRGSTRQWDGDPKATACPPCRAKVAKFKPNLAQALQPSPAPERCIRLKRQRIRIGLRVRFPTTLKPGSKSQRTGCVQLIPVTPDAHPSHPSGPARGRPSSVQGPGYLCAS